MPFCPYTFLRPVIGVAESALKRVNAANDSLRPYSNLLFGLFSLNLVLRLYSPSFEFGGPDKPVDSKKVGPMRDGSVQYSWFHWKPFLSYVNLSVFYSLRTIYGIDWWTDLWALSFLSIDAAERFISLYLGNHPWKMTILGGVSLPTFQLIPQNGNVYDSLRIKLTEWKYDLGLLVRRLALTRLAGVSLWSLYKQWFLNKD